VSTDRFTKTGARRGIGFGHGTDAEDRNRGRIKNNESFDAAMAVMPGARSKRDSFKREASKRQEVFPGQTVGTHRPDRKESAYDLGSRNKRSVWSIATQPFSCAHFATFPPALVEPCILAGSRPGDICLDPFFGSGTVGQVAQQLGRQWIGCELNEAEYGPLIERRTAQSGMVFAEQPAANA
jgi:DNA modification methylase